MPDDPAEAAPGAPVSGTDGAAGGRGKRVVITGAAGNLGGKLRAYLEASGGWDLVLIDQDGGGDPAIVEADLADPAASWPALFRGADAVVHLAGSATQDQSWRQLESAILDPTLAVFDAAAAERVPRVVYAASGTAMEGWRHTEEPLTRDRPPWPTSLYAAAKLAGERIGRLYAARHGLSVICLRIGMIRPGDNPPPASHELWAQRLWLGNGDFCRGVERSILAADVTFATINLVSDNAGTTWGLGPARDIIGFIPADRSTPRSPALHRWPVFLLRRLRRRLRRLAS